MIKINVDEKICICKIKIVTREKQFITHLLKIMSTEVILHKQILIIFIFSEHWTEVYLTIKILAMATTMEE